MRCTEFPEKLINVFIRVPSMKEDGFPETTIIPDENLIELFITANDEGAFEEIVNRYRDKIYGLAFRITRDHHSAEEVLQKVFLTLTKRADTFRRDAKFSTWLYRVTLNASYMRLRAHKRYEEDISLEDYAPYNETWCLQGRISVKDWSDKPDKALFKKETIVMVEKAVNELPEPYGGYFSSK